MKKFVLFTAVATMAALVSTSAVAQSAPKPDPLKEMDEFIAVYKRVKASYVDKIDDKQLMEGAIQGMLNTLDPHSAFFEQERLSKPTDAD